MPRRHVRQPDRAPLPHRRRPARPRAHHRGQHRRDAARGAHRAARGRRRAAGGQELHRGGQGQGARRRGERQPHPGPGLHRHPAPRAGHAAWAGGGTGLQLRAQPPVVVLLAGLQGAGKTTTAAKLARWLIERAEEARAAGEHRRAPAGGHAAARAPRRPGRGRVFPGATQPTAPAAIAQAALVRARTRRLRRADRRHRRPAARRCGADGGGAGDRCRGRRPPSGCSWWTPWPARTRSTPPAPSARRWISPASS